MGKILLLLFLFVDLAVALLFLPFREWFLQFEGYVQDLGAAGPALVVLVYAAATVLLIPGSALTVAAGTLFGLPTGLLVALTGANLGAFAAFLLARTRLREKIARWTEDSGKVRLLDEAIGANGFKVVLLMRLSPAFPFTILNYLLGLTAVRPAAYALANLVGMLPGGLLYVYLGVAARDVLAGNRLPGIGVYQQVAKYLGFFATIALVWVITRIARKALRTAERGESNNLVAERTSGKSALPVRGG